MHTSRSSFFVFLFFSVMECVFIRRTGGIRYIILFFWAITCGSIISDVRTEVVLQWLGLHWGLPVCRAGFARGLISDTLKVYGLCL